MSTTYCYYNIFDAIKNSDIEAVKSFLPEHLNIRNYSGETPLQCACRYGHIKIVCLLLDSGADIEARNDNGWTPLHCASIHGHVKVVGLLLERGADIEAKDNDGCIPLLRACLVKKYAVSEYLVGHGADPFIKNKYGKSAYDLDDMYIKVEGLEDRIRHGEILMQLRAEYLNKYTLSESNRTAVITSGWEMEL